MNLREVRYPILILLTFLAGFLFGRSYERQVLNPPDISGAYAGPRMSAERQQGDLSKGS